MLPNLSTTESNDERCRPQGPELDAIALSSSCCASHNNRGLLPSHRYDAAERHSTKDEDVGIAGEICLNIGSLKHGHMRQK
jgi:hypothetical protein